MNENLLPSVLQYSKYLDVITAKTGITRNAARKKYGLFTIAQWEQELKK